MSIEYLKEYINLCIKFSLKPSWNGLNAFKAIKKGIQ